MKDQVVKFILAILEGEFHHTGFERPDIYSIPSVYQKNSGNFWVALEQNKLIGTIGLINQGLGRGYIKRMAVDPVYRGKGLAQKLLSILLDFAALHDYKNLYLSTSKNMVAAQKFYEKENFKKIRQLPEGFKLPITDSLFYKKSLQ